MLSGLKAASGKRPRTHDYREAKSRTSINHVAVGHVMSQPMTWTLVIWRPGVKWLARLAARYMVVAPTIHVTFARGCLRATPPNASARGIFLGPGWRSAPASSCPRRRVFNACCGVFVCDVVRQPAGPSPEASYPHRYPRCGISLPRFVRSVDSRE